MRDMEQAGALRHTPPDSLRLTRCLCPNNLVTLVKDVPRLPSADKAATGCCAAAAAAACSRRRRKAAPTAAPQQLQTAGYCRHRQRCCLSRRSTCGKHGVQACRRAERLPTGVSKRRKRLERSLIYAES